jgi:hypothetical protein
MSNSDMGSLSNSKFEIRNQRGGGGMEQVFILLAAIGSMFGLIALTIWLAWLSASRGNEDSP